MSSSCVTHIQMSVREHKHIFELMTLNFPWTVCLLLENSLIICFVDRMIN